MSNVIAWMAHSPYRLLVGSLNYVTVATHPDIAFTVGRLSTVLDCYRPEHWDAAVRVVRYLKGTHLFSLELGGVNPLRPIIFADSDYANCPNTSHSIGGYCLLPHSWFRDGFMGLVETEAHSRLIVLHGIHYSP